MLCSVICGNGTVITTVEQNLTRTLHLYWHWLNWSPSRSCHLSDDLTMDVMTGEWTGCRWIVRCFLEDRIVGKRISSLWLVCTQRRLDTRKDGWRGKCRQNFVARSLHIVFTDVGNWVSLTLSSFSLYRSRRGYGFVVKVVKWFLDRSCLSTSSTWDLLVLLDTTINNCQTG